MRLIQGNKLGESVNGGNKESTTMSQSNEQRWILKKIMIFALLGCGLSVLLLREHYDDRQHFCDFNAVFSCSTVNKSEYAVLFHVPVALLGLSWNIFLAIAAWSAGKQEPTSPLSGWFAVFFALWTGSGVGFVAYLIFAEYILGSVCLLCTLVHLLTFANVYSSYQLWRLSFRSRQALSDKAPGLIRHFQVAVVLFFVLFVVPLISFNTAVMSHAEQEIIAAESVHRQLEIEELSKCVTQRNFVMYGSLACGHCQHQKQLLDSGFVFIDFVECDQRCTKEFKIGGFPTWVAYEDASKTTEITRVVGVQTPLELAKISGCLATASTE